MQTGYWNYIQRSVISGCYYAVICKETMLGPIAVTLATKRQLLSNL